MKCPKDRKVELVDGWLTDDLAVKCCPDCQGNWIPLAAYDEWRSQQPEWTRQRGAISDASEIDIQVSEKDARAGLCPKCDRYLSRSKIRIKTPFYVERCPNCGGFWCDRGEWEALQELGLIYNLEQVFSGEWQSQIRSVEFLEKERQAIVEKLGRKVAFKIFELAEILEQHPNGDFGVAYLMRRLDKPQ